MFDHRNARGEEQAVGRAPPVGDVVDVDRVDADETRPLLDEEAGACLSQVGGVCRVLGSAPVLVPAGMQQHGAVGHLVRRQRPKVHLS